MKRLLIAGLAFMLAFIAVVPSTHAQDNAAASTLYITPDGRFSVELPDGWAATGDATGLQVANRPEMLTDDSLELQPGDLGFVVMAIGWEDLAAFTFPADATLLQIGEFLLPFLLSGQGDAVTVGQPGEVEYADETVIRAVATDATNTYALHLFDNLAPGYMGVRIFTGLSGEFGEGEENEMLAIAKTVQYSLELSQTHTSDNGTVTFNFPTNFVAIEDQPTVHYIYDSEATREAADADQDIAADQVAMATIVVDPAQLPEINEEMVKLVAQEVASQIAEDSDNNPVLTEPVVLESEALIGTTVVIEASSEVSKGGVVVVYNEPANVIAIVAYVGDVQDGGQLLLTALNIANSMTATFSEAS